LGKEEQEEELLEILEWGLVVNGDDNKDKSYFEHLPQDNYIGQLDLIINALQVDIVACYYRS
jgi:hypothetical protein